MTTWFTADNHFNHARIVEYCARPFVTLDGHPDVEGMNLHMINLWNAVVGDEDTVYHLGDFGFGGLATIAEILGTIRGRKILIKGNHDRHTVAAYVRAGFAEVHKSLVLDGNLLIHRPPLADDPVLQAHPFVLHGHVHQHWKTRGNCINVGVDVRGFRPVRLEELLCTT